MLTTPRSVVSIGECMVELAREPDGSYRMRFGGDTFNTAVYLARSGVQVAYATVLGDDPYSAAILELAHAEGIGTQLIARRTGRNAGLYLIEISERGERTFHYWRDRAPARELFDDPDADRIVSAMSSTGLVYLSGVTLSLYRPAARDRLADALVAARARGVRVAMDGNYRPRGWNGDLALARSQFERFWRLADIALPSLEDGTLLWGDDEPTALVDRLRGLGVGEIVVKCEAAPALCADAQESIAVPLPERAVPVDTTAAGDSFNAAYLAARLSGAAPARAALAGHRLAAIVVQHRGAIVPRDASEAALAR